MWVKVKRGESWLKVEIFYVKQSMMLIKHMNLGYQMHDDRLALDGSTGCPEKRGFQNFE